MKKMAISDLVSSSRLEMCKGMDFARGKSRRSQLEKERDIFFEMHFASPEIAFSQLPGFSIFNTLLCSLLAAGACIDFFSRVLVRAAAFCADSSHDINSCRKPLADRKSEDSMHP